LIPIPTNRIAAKTNTRCGHWNNLRISLIKFHLGAPIFRVLGLPGTGTRLEKVELERLLGGPPRIALEDIVKHPRLPAARKVYLDRFLEVYAIRFWRGCSSSQGESSFSISWSSLRPRRTRSAATPGSRSGF
jgi:hypothetical protein